MLVFNNRIRVARAEKRITQAELAKMVGVSRQTIGSIEKLQYCPSAQLAYLLCVALDTTFEELFYFEERFPALSALSNEASHDDDAQTDQ